MSGFLCTMVGATFTVAVTPQVLRAKKTITANGNAQVSTAQSKFGGASLLLDGNGDYLTLGTQSDLNFGTNDFTVEAWVRFDQLSTTNRHTLISNGITSFTTNWIKFSAADLGAAYYPQVTAYNYSSGGAPLMTSSTAVSNNTWYHIAYVRYNTDHFLYLDGVQVASNSDSTAKSISVNWNANNITNIGRYSFDNGTNPSSTYFDGYIDELRISNTARYTSAFTPSTTPFVDDNNTLLLIHADGTDASTVFTDDNGISRSQTGITAIGNAQVDTAQSKFGGASLLGDGTGDYLQLGTYSHLNLTGDFTVECWYRIPSTVPAILPFYNTDHLFYLTNDGGTAKYALFSGGSNRLLSSGITVSANTWYHFAMVRSGTTVTAYHNGVSAGSATWAGTISNTTPTIGSYSSYYINGWYDEFRISNSARYTTTFTPSTTAFVNDSNTLLLLHMDGTDASTVFTDDNAQLTVTPAATSVDEGSSLTFNVSTINTANQTLYWTVTNSGDFGTSSGSFSLTNNAGSFSVTPTADTTTEGAETFTASVRTGSTSGDIIATTPSVTINDTSVASVPATAFDGTGDYFEAAIGSSSGVADSAYVTIAGLVYQNSGSASEQNLLQVQLGTASGNTGINLNHWGGGILLFQPDPSGSDISSVYGTSMAPQGAWAQFVLYVDFTNFANCKFYVNGTDYTSSYLLNGPSYGERGVDGQSLNWTSSTTVKINVGSYFTYAGARDVNDYNGKIQYLLVRTGSGAPTISNYWDSTAGKPKDLGTNGNATGLNPVIYHYGNTSTFGVNNASNKFVTYTMTKYGNASDTSGTPYA